MNGGAAISHDGRYRYTLRRSWGPSTPGDGPLFIMLNPSTADANVNDPTIRRCIGFAKREGFHSLDVVNLYALRATKPSALNGDTDPIGDANDQCIEAMLVRRTGPVVAAWGASAMRVGIGQARVDRVLRVLRTSGRSAIWCLGMTRDGHPRHPLYVRADQPLERWVPRP